MARTPNWPPRLTRKPGTTTARTYHGGRWWICGRWDDKRNRPTAEAVNRHLEYVNVWASDPDANPTGEPLAVEVLADWLASPDAPVHRADRAWIPKVISLLESWRTELSADQFGAAILAEFQNWLCEKYNRTSVRKIVNFVRRAFTWGAREARYGISWEQVAAMKAVSAPKPGRVREANVVMPAKESDWRAVVDASPPQLAAILGLLWWTGARPNELLSLRAGDIQREGVLTIPKVAPVRLGEVWAAQVRSKVSRLGHVRCLMFGPRSQLILTPILAGLKPKDLLFTPAKALDREPGERTSKRLREAYSPSALSHAVKYACRRAGVSITAYGIRHAVSERIQAAMGRDAEAALLGHGGASITARYAGLDSTLAVKVALFCG